MKGKAIKKYAAVIIDRKNRFLIVKERGEDYFKNAGGKPEPGESVKQCIRRELKEELGVSVKKIKHYYTLPITPITLDTKYKNKKVRIILYRTQISGTLKASGEIEEIHWLTHKDIKDKKFKLTRQIRQYIAPRLILDKLLK